MLAFSRHRGALDRKPSMQARRKHKHRHITSSAHTWKPQKLVMCKAFSHNPWPLLLLQLHTQGRSCDGRPYLVLCTLWPGSMMYGRRCGTPHVSHGQASRDLLGREMEQGFCAKPPRWEVKQSTSCGRHGRDRPIKLRNLNTCPGPHAIKATTHTNAPAQPWS